MYTPETSSLFEKRVNPQNGAVYYVLTAKVAAFQQGFYFVNNSMTEDGRYLWFYASFPPRTTNTITNAATTIAALTAVNIIERALFDEAVLEFACVLVLLELTILLSTLDKGLYKSIERLALSIDFTILNGIIVVGSKVLTVSLAALKGIPIAISR